MNEDTITEYDDLGRPVEIDRSDWQDQLLPQLLEEAWDNADELYEHIVRGVEQGFAPSLVEAAQRLTRIDNDAERCAVTDAVVLMHANDLEGAEEALQSFVARHGRSAIVLSNLARVRYEKGDVAGAERLLREALDLDPNQNNGLDWWGALCSEIGGPEAYLGGLREIAALPGAWRPQIWIAQQLLCDGEIEEALDLYREILPAAAACGDALMQITGDLGNAGLLPEMLDLTLPVYEPTQHGPYAGLNMARGLLELDRIDEARTLLDTLQGLQAPQLTETLNQLELDIADAAGGPAPLDEEPTLVMVRGPVWLQEHAEHLLPRLSPASERIVFLSLNDATRDPEVEQLEPITPFGRFARALPLYLAERLRITTDADARTVVPIARGAGPILPGLPWDVEWVVDQIDPAERPDVLVHGGLEPTEDGNQLVLRLFDPNEGKELRAIILPLTDDHASHVPEIEAAVLEALESTGRLRPRRPRRGFTIPAGDAQAAYLLMTSFLFAQLLVANDLIPRSVLTNERSILTGYFRLVECLPEAVPARLLAIRGVLAANRYSSPVAVHFLRPLLGVIDEQSDKLGDFLPDVRALLDEQGAG